MMLKDLSSSQIKATLEVLENRCQPAVVTSAGDLTTDERRYQLAFAAGRHSVVMDLRTALKQATEHERSREGIAKALA